MIPSAVAGTARSWPRGHPKGARGIHCRSAERGAAECECNDNSTCPLCHFQNAMGLRVGDSIVRSGTPVNRSCHLAETSFILNCKYLVRQKWLVSSLVIPLHSIPLSDRSFLATLCCLIVPPGVLLTSEKTSECLEWETEAGKPNPGRPGMSPAP